MKYTVNTVKTHCLEEPDLPYEDGAYTICLYVDGERRNAIKEGREEGRKEERKNTLLEKERTDEAEKRVAELERQLASLQKTCRNKFR